jgi:hypothetical protein
MGGLGSAVVLLTAPSLARTLNDRKRLLRVEGRAPQAMVVE